MNKKIKKLNLIALALISVSTFALGVKLTVPAIAAEGSAEFNLENYTVSDILQTDGASVRVDDTDTLDKDETGIRFPIIVNQTNYNEMLTAATADGYETKLYAAIIPTVYLSEQELDVAKTSYTYNEKERNVLHIPLEKIFKTEMVDQTEFATYYATLTDIPNLNYETDLTAKGYVKFTKDGTEAQYLQTEKVERSIGEVILAEYSDEESEFDKDELQSLLKNSLAESLPNGYLAEFSSNLYTGLVGRLNVNYDAPTAITYLPNGYGGVNTGVLKIEMKTQSKSSGVFSGFQLKLPKTANKIQLKVYYEESGSSGYVDVVDENLQVLTNIPSGNCQESWTTATVDYATAPEQLIIRTATGSEKDCTLYVAWIMENVDLTSTLEGNELADFSSSHYVSKVSPLSGHNDPVVTYLENGYQGIETGVLKIEMETTVDTNNYGGFRLSLPKSSNGGAVKIKLYFETFEDRGGGVYVVDSSLNRLTSGGTKIDMATRNSWQEITVDYTESINEIIIRTYTGSPRVATVYLALIEDVVE